ncbi:MAG: hypothetical protein V1676_07660 [Candidatus Diapherotrites archaeon]
MDKVFAEMKRNCKLCSGRRMLMPNAPEKYAVQDTLKELHSHYTSEYNELRRADASSQAINNATYNKRFALDLLSECKACDKETDIVNRKLQQFRR